MVEFLQMIENENIELLEVNMKGRNKGFYIDGTIFIDSKMSDIDKRCKLAEELGHHFTSSGDITDQSKIENRKQERKARIWGYDKLVPIHRLAEAIDYKVHNQKELADYLEITEKVLLEALKYYKEKYGLYCSFNEYVICFEPLSLMKKFE